MTQTLHRAIAPLLFAALPHMAFADETPQAITTDGAVALQASVLAEGTLNEAQIQVLKDVAHQKAVVLTCEFDALDEAGQIHLRSVMMLVLGTFLGGNLAIASTDAAGWCTQAAQEKAQTDAPNRVWAD